MAITKALAGEGVEMVLAADTVGAAMHAQARGFIEAAAISDIRGEKAKDEAAPGPLESMVKGNR